MRRPRLSLALSRRLSIHAAALAAFLSTTTGGEVPTVVSALFLLAVGVSLFKGDRQVRGLGALLTVGTAGVGVVVLLLVTRGPVDIVLGATLFAAAVCINRLLARRTAADDPLLLLTTLLLLAAGAALSGEATYGLCFAAYGFSATLALTFSHLERAADQAGVTTAARDALLAGGLGRALAGLALLALFGAAVIFVFFPRVNAQWLARHSGAGHAAAIGFANRVELGGVGTLRADPRPALRVRFPDYAGRPLPREVLEPGSERLSVLWRGQALDTFDGHGWASSPEAERAVKPLPNHPGRKPYGLRAAVEVLPLVGGRVLFSPGTALAAAHPHRQGTPWEQPFLIMQKQSGDVARDRAPDEAWEYEVWSTRIDPALRGHGRSYPEAITARDLQLPARLDPRVAELARTWTHGLTDPIDQAEAIVEHLHKDFTYTVELQAGSADPIADFLFVRKAGHCEYFSSAMALMLRTLGVPAREVTGFSGGVPAPGDDYFIVRAGDAHSWVELYVPGVGFVSFDPTPPSAAAASPSGLSAYLAELGDTISERWRRAVVDYDLATQVDALRQAGRALSRAADRFSRDPDQPSGGKLAMAPVLKLAALLGLLVVVAVAVRRVRRKPATAGDEAARAFEAVQAALASRGISRGPSETARELASRLESQRRGEAGPLREFTALYEDARFAGRPWGEPERAKVKQLLAQLRRARASGSSPRAGSR